METFIHSLKTDDVDLFNETKGELEKSDEKINTIFPDIFDSNPTLIAYASFYGAIECFNFLIRQGESAENVDDESRSAIHFASAGGKSQMVIKLIDEFDQLSHIDSLGRTCLHYATEYNQSEIVKILVDLHMEKFEGTIGASTFINKKDIFGATAFHIAIENQNEHLIDYFYENGANINLSDSDGCTPLHIAAKIGSINIISYLLQKGAKLNRNSKNGRTIFHFAAFSANPIFSDLIDIINKYGETRININVPDKFGRIPLHYACELGSISAVEELLRLHSDVSFRDVDQRLPIHFAAVKGNTEVISLLIKYRSPVYAKDSELMTPLHIACECGSYKAAKFLCRKYKNLVNEETKNGLTPLHSLAASELNKDNHELAQFLISKGSDVNKKDKFGMTPLQCAIQNGYVNTIEVLVESGADLCVADCGGDDEIKMKCLSPKRFATSSRYSSAYHSPCSSPSISRKSPNRLTTNQSVFALEPL